MVDSLDVNSASGARANMAIVQNLSQSFNLTVLHGSESDLSLSLINAIKVKELKWNWRYVLSRTVRLLRRYVGLNVNSFFEKRVGFSFTFLSLSYSFQKALNSLNLSHFHLVLTLSQGERFVPHHAVLNAPCIHEKWLAYIHDPYPMACYPLNYAFTGPGTEQKKRFMQDVFHHASVLSFPSLLLSQWMGKFYEFESNKVEIIPHQNSQSLCLNSLIAENKFFNQEKFNLLHAGSLLDQRNPIPLIEGFLEFMNDNLEFRDQCQLFFIGPISPTFSQKINDLKSNNVKFFSSKKFDLTFNLQKKASVNIIIEANNEDISPFLPAKFSQCIAANKPILYLGPRNSEVIRLLGLEYKFSAQVDDVKKIKAVIGELFNDWKRKKEFGFNQELINYLGSEHLKKIIESIILHD